MGGVPSSRYRVHRRGSWGDETGNLAGTTRSLRNYDCCHYHCVRFRLVLLFGGRSIHSGGQQAPQWSEGAILKTRAKLANLGWMLQGDGYKINAETMVHHSCLLGL